MQRPPPAPSTTPFTSPRLLADIGGIHARFTLETAQGMFQHTASLRCAEHADFHAAVTAFLGGLPAGTGLGVSGLIPLVGPVGGCVALGTEGSHTSFAPRDEREIAILRHGLKLHPHLSFERLLSGPGLELIHHALCERAGCAAEALAAPEITRRALVDHDPLCAETPEAFCAILGTAASDLAMTLGALGGIYIGGGIVPRLGKVFDRSGFRARFENKGRFSDYCKVIPTFVVTAEHAPSTGRRRRLDAQLRTRRPGYQRGRHFGASHFAQPWIRAE